VIVYIGYILNRFLLSAGAPLQLIDLDGVILGVPVIIGSVTDAVLPKDIDDVDAPFIAVSAAGENFDA